MLDFKNVTSHKINSYHYFQTGTMHVWPGKLWENMKNYSTMKPGNPSPEIGGQLGFPCQLDILELGNGISLDPLYTFLTQPVSFIHNSWRTTLYFFTLIKLKIISVSDVWNTLGHYKARAIMRLLINVREPYPICLKSTKFHNSTTYCPAVPLNWVYCPLNTP